MATPFNIDPITTDEDALLALENEEGNEGQDVEEEQPSQVGELQRQMQQLAMQVQQERMQAQQQVQQQKLQTLQFYVNQLKTKEERDYANSLIQKHYREEGEKAQMAELVKYTKSLEGYALDKLKKDVTRGISEKYKVEKELLQGIDAKHPSELENVAKAIARYKKQMGFQNRVMNGNDRVPTSSQQSSNSTAKSALMKDFKNSGRIADFIRRGGLQ